MILNEIKFIHFLVKCYEFFFSVINAKQFCKSGDQTWHCPCHPTAFPLSYILCPKNLFNTEEKIFCMQ